MTNKNKGGNCCNILAFLVLVLSVLMGYGYLNKAALFEWAVKRNFSQYEYGTLCLRYKGDENNDVEKYGLHSNNASPCDGTIIINDRSKFFETLATGGGSTGLGEAYFESYWDIDESDPESLSTVLYHIFWNQFNMPNRRRPLKFIINSLFEYKTLFHYLKRLFAETKTLQEDVDDIEYHYDKGYTFGYDITTEFWESYLGPTRTGSCAIWDDTTKTLEDAQNNKWNIIINKLDVESDDSVLDVGCGWGYACSKINNDTNANCTGITLSKDQLAAAKEKWHSQLCSVRTNEEIKKYGCLKFKFLDYRLSAKEFGENVFTKVVSVGMVEHVGYKKIQEYFDVLAKVLKPSGKMLIHGITVDDVFPDYLPVTRSTMCTSSNFISKYIFPGGCILHPDYMTESAVNSGLVIIHRENYGKHYAITLNEWLHNMRRNWPNLKNKGNLDKRFYKLHEFYFTMCEAAFRAGRVELSHFLFVKPEYSNGRNYDATFYLRDTIKNPNVPANRCKKQQNNK